MGPKKKLDFLNLSRACGDPFKVHKSLVRSGIRNTTEEVRLKCKDLCLPIPEKICKHCRTKVLEASCASKSSSSSTTSQCSTEDEQLAMCDVDSALLAIGSSPVRKRKIACNKKYKDKKMESISSKLANAVSYYNNDNFLRSVSEDTQYNKALWCDEIISDLKSKFKDTTKRSEKPKTLNFLPTS